MTTNDEPYVPYRASYVAGLERQLAEQREAMAQAVEELEAVRDHDAHERIEAALAALRRVATATGSSPTIEAVE